MTTGTPIRSDSIVVVVPAYGNVSSEISIREYASRCERVDGVTISMSIREGSTPASRKAVEQLSLIWLAAKALDLKTILESGTPHMILAQRLTTDALIFATLLKLPKVTCPKHSLGAGDGAGVSTGGV